jgi:mannan endo-1,4-beta-mannosidase
VKPRIRRRRLGVAAVITAPLGVASALLIAFTSHPGGIFGYGFGFGGASGAQVVCPAKPPTPPLVGLSPATPWEDSLLQFTSAAKIEPHLLVAYVPFGGTFPASHACLAVAQHGELMIQMNPRSQPIAAIANGRYDPYLTRFAHAIRDSHAPIVFSFAHEMNGAWYPWGFGHTDPTVFVAAWRHIWRVFHQAGAQATYCWNVNRYSPDNTSTVAPPSLWWPGRRYVDWVGIDAYYKTPTETYGQVFGSTVAAVRHFTTRPILIAETAIGPSAVRPAQIASLFAGVAAHHLVGVVWFDINRKQRWRIDTDPAALGAFRTAAHHLTKEQP